MKEGIFERDLEKVPANFVPQTPLGFLDWATHVYPNKVAIIHGDIKYTYSQFRSRALRLASALNKRGIKKGYETVLDRTIKIIWAVFGLGWLIILIYSIIVGKSPVPLILFLLGLVLVMNGLIIKFKPLTIGGMILFIFVFVLFIDPNINYLIINIIGVTLGMLIPGLFLYRMKNSE